MSEQPDLSEPDRDSDEPEAQSLADEIRELVAAARARAETELAFQAARAGLLARFAAIAAGLGCLALILLFYALMAAVFGLVLALTQAIGAWAATGVVVGGLVLVALLALLLVWGRVRRIGALLRKDPR